MIYDTAQIILFKNEYLEKLKKSSVKVSLNPYHKGRHDAWAKDVLGDAEYSFMYPILIQNEDDAMDNGYFLAGN